MGIGLIKRIKDLKFYNLLCKALVITCIVAIIDSAGIAFLVLKTVSFIFVPNKNIDNMSDFYTVVWSSINDNPTDNGRFLLVDITQNNRRDISNILKTINSLNPHIIGLDMSCIHEEDKTIDSLLVEVVLSIPNIVLPVEYDAKTNSYLPDVFHDKFVRKKHGVVSFPDNREVIRTFRPSFCVGDKSIDVFGYVVAKECKANIPTLQNKDKCLINFTTLNLSDEYAIQGSNFLKLNSRDDTLRLTPLISNKIVVVGSFHDTEDYHLTPLGFMSGPMIHANIINCLLENKIITTTPSYLRYFLCFLVSIAILLWYKGRKLEIKEQNITGTIVKYLVIFVLCIILISGIGTFLFCKLCYYVDFEPYIVMLIIIYFLKDKNFNFRKICVR